MKRSPGDPLLQEFEPLRAETWKEMIIRELKGADYEKKMVWVSEDGIRVNPFYMQQDLDGLGYLNSVSALKPSPEIPNGWTICQQISENGDPSQGNRQIREALKGGAAAVRIPWNLENPASADYLESLLKGIPLQEMEMHFEGNLAADALFRFFLKFRGDSGMDPAALKGCLGADPLGNMVTTGYPAVITENLGNLVRSGTSETPGLKILGVDGNLFQNSGSTLVQELAFSLSMASEYMSVLTDQGLDPAEVVNSIQLHLASGPDFFMEIAKLRAARILWNAMCEGFGLPDEQATVRIHSISSTWNMTLLDQHVNMLRATTSTMSSVLGGADIITVIPFDHPHYRNRTFSDRIARNVQLILREESYLERVRDPASGSYYIEALTDSIAEKAWDLFRKTENEGGFSEAFRKGAIQEQVLQSRKRKTEATASGRMRLLGTNAFPNPGERIFSGRSVKNGVSPEAIPSGSPVLKPLRPFHLAAGFEELRMETASAKRRPRVFLLKFGDPEQSGARAAFSTYFFACAGYDIIDPPPVGDLKVAISQAQNAGPDILVLCSSDKHYPEIAGTVGKAMHEKSILAVAGQPGNMKEELEVYGFKHFIHMDLDLLDSLRNFNRLLLTFNS